MIAKKLKKLKQKKRKERKKNKDHSLGLLMGFLEENQLGTYLWGFLKRANQVTNLWANEKMLHG